MASGFVGTDHQHDADPSVPSKRPRIEPPKAKTLDEGQVAGIADDVAKATSTVGNLPVRADEVVASDHVSDVLSDLVSPPAEDSVASPGNISGETLMTGGADGDASQNGSSKD